MTPDLPWRHIRSNGVAVAYLPGGREYTVQPAGSDGQFAVTYEAYGEFDVIGRCPTRPAAKRFAAEYESALRRAAREQRDGARQ